MPYSHDLPSILLLLSFFLHAVYAVFSLLCIVSFFRAVTTSPGMTPDPLMANADGKFNSCHVITCLSHESSLSSFRDLDLL